MNKEASRKNLIVKNSIHLINPDSNTTLKHHIDSDLTKTLFRRNKTLEKLVFYGKYFWQQQVTLTNEIQSWGSRSVVEHVPSMPKTQA